MARVEQGGDVCTFGGMSRARSGMWRSPMTRIKNAMLTGDVKGVDGSAGMRELPAVRPGVARPI